MDPLHFSIAVGPLAVYLLLIGMLNLSPRPFLTTGARDTAALGVAISGFVVAGPMELFLPEAAVARFGGFVWLLLLALYGLCLTLLVLLMRPRLVIYNITTEQLRPIMAGVVAEVDQEGRWAGECLVLPSLGVQLHVENIDSLRNCQLLSAGPNQNYMGWRRLEISLARALRSTKSVPNPYGFFQMSLGLIIVATVMVWMLADRQGVTHALSEMLRQ